MCPLRRLNIAINSSAVPINFISITDLIILINVHLHTMFVKPTGALAIALDTLFCIEDILNTNFGGMSHYFSWLGQLTVDFRVAI